MTPISSIASVSVQDAPIVAASAEIIGLKTATRELIG
jgi:hypothetical protein